MDYWETKLPFCEVFTVAFSVHILNKKRKKEKKTNKQTGIVKEHFSVYALQPTLTYIHNVCVDKKKIVNIR